MNFPFNTLMIIETKGIKLEFKWHSKKIWLNFDVIGFFLVFFYIFISYIYHIWRIKHIQTG